MLYLFIYRGHTVNAVCESFQGAKDAGFKVVAHMMPDLPNVGLERDIEQFIVSTKTWMIFVWNIRVSFRGGGICPPPLKACSLPPPLLNFQNLSFIIVFIIMYTECIMLNHSCP